MTLKISTLYYKRIKILTPAGLTYADVELPYNGREMKIISISGQTTHADGTVVKFSGKPLDKVVEKSHGFKEKVKSFALPDVQVGSVIDVRYTLSYGDFHLLPPDWDVQLDLFQKKASFKFFPYMDEWTEKETGRSGQGVAWTPYIPPPNPQPQIHKALQGAYAPRGSTGDYVSLDLENIPALVEEPYMPPPALLRWRVNFYYRTSAKQDEFWKTEGKYWNKEVDSFLDKKDGISAALAKVISPSDTPEVKARKIYAYVSDFENRSFEPEKTEQVLNAGGARINRGADDVLQQRSGTHDDLNRLFVAMLRVAAVPAWMIRVPDREQFIYQAAFLDARQFDAELAIVELNGKDVYLDPGTRFCPYGMLPWHYSGVQGQRQSPSKGTEIATTTFPLYKQAMIQRTAVLTLQPDGLEQGTVTVGFLGLEAMDRRQHAAQTDAEGKKKLLEDEVKKWLPNGTEVTLTNEPAWNDAGALVAEFKISGPLGTSAGKRKVLPLHIFEINDAPMFSAAMRNNGVYFYEPSCRFDEIHITLPAGTEIESMPPADSARLDYALYESSQQMENPSTILATRNIIMGGMAFPVGEYKQLKSFYDKVSVDDGQQVLLKAAAHAEGN